MTAIGGAYFRIAIASGAVADPTNATSPCLFFFSAILGVSIPTIEKAVNEEILGHVAVETLVVQSLPYEDPTTLVTKV